MEIVENDQQSAECYCCCCKEKSHLSEIALCEAGPLIRHFLHSSASAFVTEGEV